MAFILPFPVSLSSGVVRSKFTRCLIPARNNTTCPLVRMSSAGEGEPPQHPKTDNPELAQTHISAQFAIDALSDAVLDADGNLSTVAEKCTQGFVEAFCQCYNSDDATGIFIVCGNGFNGLVGVHAAIALKKLGYEPSVYALGESRHINISSVCSEHGIAVYDFIPSTLEFYFQVVVDALLGLGFNGGDIKQRYWSVYEMLVSTRVAVVSVDVPSGWDLETGPRQIDYTADTFIKPEVLVSFGAPKNCSKVFAGGYHFIAGRHLPQQYFIERGISVPLFPGEDANCVLLSSNPFRFQGDNGEMYGRRGQYNATLFTKNPSRTWVDVESDMDLWDELD